MVPEQLAQICPECKDPVSVAMALNSAFVRFGISTVEEQAAFVAQTAHESGQFNTMVENLNYSAKGLAATWPGRYADKKDTDHDGDTHEPNALALKIARHPQDIANYTYADRMGNGGPETNEGWTYRGRGWIMLTGKANYIEFSEETGIDAVNDPDIIATPDGAAMSAGWYWQKHHCGAAANNCKQLTKIINGGDVGLAEREELTELSRKVLS
jgi:putative chitinase